MRDQDSPALFQELLTSLTEISGEFLRDLPKRPVAQLNPLLPEQAMSVQGAGVVAAIAQLRQTIMPQLSASRGPRYWGFVTGGATPVATFADWLVSLFDQNVSVGGDSIASAVERQTLRWLCQLFGLPADFDGVITTGATASNFLGALCARQFVGLQQGLDVAKQGAFGLQVEIFATTPHASMVKALGMAGLGHKLSRVAALPDSEAMDVADLERLLAQSRSPGKVIIASAGTVTATDFDDLQAITALAKQYDAWLHVDAAFGMFERLIAGSNTRSAGLEWADSITLDSHKWLNVPYESGVFLTRHLPVLFASCNVMAPYLASDRSLPDFMSLGFENSRRFRALPVWLTLLSYGVEGITEQIASNVALAQLFADKIAQSADYDLMLPCRLNVVLFRPRCTGLSPEAAKQKTADIMRRINQSGQVFVSPGQWQGQAVIRAALSNWSTRAADVDQAWAVLERVAGDYRQTHGE